MRRLLGLIATALVAITSIITVAPARAQASVVTMQLLQQSPWVAQYHRSMLDIAVLVTNASTEPLTDMSLVVSFGPHYLSRGDFEASLSAGIDGAIASRSKTVRGELGGGGARTIEYQIDLSTVAEIDQSDSQTYPAVIELRTGDTSVASLLTPVIYLVRPPDSPMLSSTWVSLPAPVALDPGGTLVDPSFEAALGPAGALRAPLDAISAAIAGRHDPVSFDLVVDPLVVTQARDLADGYQLPDGTQVGADDPRAMVANRFVHKLSGVASDTASIETVANLYANPLLPAMLSSGLGTDLEVQRNAGDTVLTAIGAVPSSTVARPSSGELSDEALAWLAGQGTSVVLANADTVDRSQAQGLLAPAPVVPVTTVFGATSLLLPDPGTQALFDRSDLLSDPVRAAQVVLGELAVIWKEEPVPTPPSVRGIAVAPPATVPSGLWAPLLERLAGTPFLTSVSATDLQARVQPSNANPEIPLQEPSALRFDPTYAASIEELGRRVDAYGSMLTQANDVSTSLRRDLFVATAPAYVADPAAGEQWLAAVRATTEQAFAAVTPTVSEDFTFTSSEGSIPMVLEGDPGDTPLQATIELRSQHFSFPAGDSQDIVVDRPGQVVTFQVVSTTSGQNPILVWVRAPNGYPITQPPITVAVRSTSVNHIALLVTMAAGLGLLALYSRRWFRRRRNPA